MFGSMCLELSRREMLPCFVAPRIAVWCVQAESATANEAASLFAEKNALAGSDSAVCACFAMLRESLFISIYSSY